MKKLFFLLTFICFACHEASKRGNISIVPVNLAEINSAFDDYNSNSPIFMESLSLFFSTNRKTSGSNFDIVHHPLDIISSYKTGKVTVEEYNVTNGYHDKVSDALYRMNTDSDELGPYIWSEGTKANATDDKYGYNVYLFLYSSNEGGNQDIKFLHNLDDESYSSPISISFLNSPQDDAYPSLTTDSSALYFCSSRKGGFDIYKATLNKNISVRQNLEDTSPKDIVEVSLLSSSADDKCPLILDNIMVFVSNRPGGFGGFDLYYSIFKNGDWAAPVNFGDKINTEFDEYRPFIKPMGKDFDNDFMIFSSNRPGGKGGFDLYYVGVPKSEQFQ